MFVDRINDKQPRLPPARREPLSALLGSAFTRLSQAHTASVQAQGNRIFLTGEKYRSE